MASSGKMSSPTTTSLDSSATSSGMILSSRNGLETRGGYLAIYRKNPTWPVASKCVTITFYTTLQKVWKITTPAGKSGLNYINSPKFAACVLLEVFVYDFLRPVFGIGVEWDTSQWCRRWLSWSFKNTLLTNTRHTSTLGRTFPILTQISCKNLLETNQLKLYSWEVGQICKLE